MKALILGANGQDGTFLTRHLLRRNYVVIASDCQEKQRFNYDSNQFSYYSLDLRNSPAIDELLTFINPDVIFHFAAVHNSAGGKYEGVLEDTLKVNSISICPILEFMRKNNKPKLIYASSAKVFGTPLPEYIKEDTQKKNQCIYSITKNTTYNLIEYYRANHKLKASVVYLFNHESELRPPEFFIPIIIKALTKSIKDSRHITELNTLDFYCNWGSAEEYMDIIIDIFEKTKVNKDYILANTTCTYAKDLVRELFVSYGLDYKNHITETSINNASCPKYSVDLSRLYSDIGRIPKLSIREICLNILKTQYLKLN